MPISSHEKKRIALAQLGGERSVIIALSGGVDSAVLLAVAMEALGSEHVLGVTGRSASVPLEELEDARQVANAVGARWAVVDTGEMSRPGYRANDGQRCFHCRTELFEVLTGLARSRGFSKVAYGAIVDDLGDDRPGMRAAEQHGILAPLLDAGINKEDVRVLAAAYELPVRDKPAAACLSSRIPVGTEVTEERLAEIALAERALRALGFVQFRVRHYGEVARIELDPEGMERIRNSGLAARVAEAVRAAGFRFVTVDVEGYRPAGGRVERLYSIGPQRPTGQ